MEKWCRKINEFKITNEDKIRIKGKVFDAKLLIKELSNDVGENKFLKKCKWRSTPISFGTGRTFCRDPKCLRDGNRTHQDRHGIFQARLGSVKRHCQTNG